MDTVGHIFLWLILIGLHFLPALVAYSRQHHQATPILLVNLFFGWTVLGWIVALVWSSSATAGQRA